MADELIDDVQPETDVEVAEPEPVEEQAAEEHEEYSPEWLSHDERDDQPQYSGPQYTPEQVAAYQRQMQMMQQQYAQPPQQRTNEDYLNEFVRDPQGYMSSVARQEAVAIAQQMLQQGVAPVQARMDAYFNAQVDMQTAEADRSIRGMYKTFSRDETFAGNKRVQQAMDNTLSGLFHDAQYQARMGNPRALQMFSQPGFAEVALAAVKAQLGVTGGARGPASVPHVESTSPSVKANRNRSFDPDTEAAIERLGPGGRDRYIKAMEDLDKYGDFEG